MNEPTVDEIEDVDVDGYDEESNALEKARNVAAGGLAGIVAILGGAACAGNTALEMNPSVDRGDVYKEHFSGRYVISGVNYEVEGWLKYRGKGEDRAEAHPPGTSGHISWSITFDVWGETDKDEISYVKVTDTNGDGRIEPSMFNGVDKVRFRDNRERQLFEQDKMVRSNILHAAKHAFYGNVDFAGGPDGDAADAEEYRPEMEAVEIEPMDLEGL